MSGLDRRIVESQSPGERSTWSTSRPWCDLNQIRSSSTRLTIAIGTENKSAAMAAIRSNDPSGGVSRMSYLRRAASRKASSVWMSLVESRSIVAVMLRLLRAGSRSSETVLAAIVGSPRPAQGLRAAPHRESAKAGVDLDRIHFSLLFLGRYGPWSISGRDRTLVVFRPKLPVVIQI
jgi:hypothetical protein